MNRIESFSGKHRFLSNFWPAPVKLDGVQYPTVENAYQAAKTLDEGARVPFETYAPGEAKRAGRRLSIAPDWESAKVDIMGYLLQQKFKDPVLRDLLYDTGNAELIEGNTWGDRYWGQCPVGVGDNILGQLLMSIRNNIQR